MTEINARPCYFLEQEEAWGSLHDLWRKAQTTRAFVWDQGITDEKTFISGWLERMKELFGFDFCLARLALWGGDLQISFPWALSSQLGSRLVTVFRDARCESQDSFVVEDLKGESGFYSLVLTPLRTLGTEPIGLLVTANFHPREFTPAELSILQSLADEFSLFLDSVQCQKNSERLLAHICHGLRTPLTAVRADCRTLGEAQEKALSEDHRQRLRQIERDAEDLLSLMQRLVGLSSDPRP